VNSGQWSVVSGQWSVVSGQWSVVSGQWLVVSLLSTFLMGYTPYPTLPFVFMGLAPEFLVKYVGYRT
jgi:hypothetical protein